MASRSRSARRQTNAPPHFALHVMSGETFIADSFLGAVRKFQLSRPADMQFKITTSDAGHFHVTLMEGFKTLRVVEVKGGDVDWASEIPMPAAPQWLEDEPFPLIDLVGWGSVTVPKFMAVPKQCGKCLMITTWLGGFMQRWTRPFSKPGQTILAWDENAEFEVKANGFVKFPQACGPWSCHACCQKWNKFAFHCARCHWPFFTDSDTANFRMEPVLDQCNQLTKSQLWCDECTLTYELRWSLPGTPSILPGGIHVNATEVAERTVTGPWWAKRKG
jgi:hypothetical protein